MDPRLRNDWSFVARISSESGEFRRLELFPVVLGYARTRLSAGEEREEILGRREHLSADMGTIFSRREGALVFERS